MDVRLTGYVASTGTGRAPIEKIAQGAPPADVTRAAAAAASSGTVGAERDRKEATFAGAPSLDRGQGDPSAAVRRKGESRECTAAPCALGAFRGSTLVVKYGGSVMGNRSLAASWADDVVRLTEAGARVVVVHGGGPALSSTLSRMGIESVFVGGHRVTTAETAEVAEMVLSGRINKEVVSLLVRAGARAIGLSGTDARILQVRPLRPEGRDLGFVAEVESVSTEPVAPADGATPPSSVTAADEQVWNINADLVAARLRRPRRLEGSSSRTSGCSEEASVPCLTAAKPNASRGEEATEHASARRRSRR